MRKRVYAIFIALAVVSAGMSACSTKGNNESAEGVAAQPGSKLSDSAGADSQLEGGSVNQEAADGNKPVGESEETPSEQVAANASSDQVLVNKLYRLPEGYVPPDLVYPDIPFTFTEKVDKRKMRKEAAEALEKLVAGAKADGVLLAGVSGYRSEERQKTLFNSYVQKEGLEAASRYSAKPGFSEHQTGLAMDVSGIDGKCAANDCFGGTKEAKWLADHSYEYGFIVRYLEGKEAITGYKYEPWHIRFVGEETAKNIYDQGITLEEYYDEYNGAVPVIVNK